MQIQEIMTRNPVCCTPSTSMQEAAKLMADNDCGEIPVLDDHKRPIGIVTDRDITCRGVAQGKDGKTAVRDMISSPVFTTTAEASLEDCCKVLAEHQIRRIPVVDQNGACCGMVSQADIARHAPEQGTGDLLRRVSKPTSGASHTPR